MNVIARFGETVSGKFVVLGGSHVLGSVLGFLAIVIAVRALGDSGFAAVAIGLSLQGYAFSVVSFGTELYAVPLTARSPEKLNRMLAVTTLLRLILAVPAFLILVVLALIGVFGPEASIVIAWTSVSVFFFALFPLWTATALEKAGVLAAVLFGGQVVIFALTLIASFVGAPPWGFVIPKVISDLAMAIVAFSWAYRRSGALDLSEAMRSVMKEVRLIAPLGFAQLSRSAMITLDIAILGLFAVASDVGKFAVAFRIYLFIFTMASRYFAIMLPLFSRRIQTGTDDLKREVRASFVRTVPIYLLGIVIVLMFAGQLLELVFGSEFAGAALTLKILTIAVTVNFLQQTYRQVLLAAGAHRVDLRNNTVAVAVKLVSIFGLSYAFGMSGAAVAMLIGDLTLYMLQKQAAGEVLSSTGVHGPDERSIVE